MYGPTIDWVLATEKDYTPVILTIVAIGIVFIFAMGASADNMLTVLPGILALVVLGVFVMGRDAPEQPTVQDRLEEHYGIEIEGSPETLDLPQGPNQSTSGVPVRLGDLSAICDVTTNNSSYAITCDGIELKPPS